LYTQSSIENKYSKLSNLYLKSSGTASTYNYGTLRQNSYTTSASSQYKSSLLDKNSVNTMLTYNFGINSSSTPSFTNEHNELLQSSSTSLNSSVSTLLTDNVSANNLNTSLSAENYTSQNSHSATTDFKPHANSLKYSLVNKSDSFNSISQLSDLQRSQSTSLPYGEENSEPRTFKFKDLKSANLSFLSSEKNIRLIDEINPTKFNPSLAKGVTNLDDLVNSSIGESITPNVYNVYSSSKNDWLSKDRINSVTSFDTAMTPSHTAVYSNNQEFIDKSSDKYAVGKDDQTPEVLKSKEETAPSHLFTTY
jgi:hypothetical protein